MSPHPRPDWADTTHVDRAERTADIYEWPESASRRIPAWQQQASSAAERQHRQRRDRLGRLADRTILVIAAAALSMAAMGLFSEAKAESLAGADKRLHAGVSSLIGFGAQLQFKNRPQAMALCMGLGVAKEVADAAGMGTASAQDLVADAVGCAAGVYLGGVVVSYRRQGGMFVGKHWEF